MKKTLTLAVFAILLNNTHSNILSVNSNLGDNKILTKAFLNGEEISLDEEQIKIKSEEFGSAINSYKPMYKDTDYEKLVNYFYKNTKHFLIKELTYLKTINKKIDAALKSENYKEAIRIYSTTLNPQFDPKTTKHDAYLISLFGIDIFHKKHAIKIKNELVFETIKREIETIRKTTLKTKTPEELKKDILNYIDDYFLLAATLTEGLKWTEACIKFFDRLQNFN